MAKKYIDADRLRARMENLKINVCNSNATESEITAALASLDFVIRLINSLQQEQPEVDLEKEIDACWQNWLSPSNQKEVEGVLPKTEFATYAHHFYGLGGINARKEEQK